MSKPHTLQGVTHTKAPAQNPNVKVTHVPPPGYLPATKPLPPTPQGKDVHRNAQASKALQASKMLNHSASATPPARKTNK